MKKLLLLILEINDLVFPWYVFMSIAILAIDIGTGGFLARMGIARKTLYWIVGASASLEIARMAIPRLKEAPKVLRATTIIKTGDLLLFTLIGTSIAWASFYYDAARELAEMAQNGGIPAIEAGCILAAIALLGAFVNGSEKKENNGEQLNTEKASAIKNAYRAREESSTTSKTGFPLWRYAHETEYKSIARHIPKGTTVLDAGCGDGTLAIALAKKGVFVTACDISERNIEKARKHAEEANVTDMMRLLIADAEALPFPDNSFDWVVSSHVLEHIPDFEKGLSEIRRITKKGAVVAMPTCLNPCAAVILGGDVFWTVSRWSPVAWFIGIGRIISNIGGIGIDEGYRGEQALPHVWRYPHVMRKELRHGGFIITQFEASSLCLPYFERLIPLMRWLEKYKNAPIVRNCGYGSIAILEKTNELPP